MKNEDFIKFLNQKFQEALYNKDYEEALKISSDLFKLTNDYFCKINMANIYYKFYKNITLAQQIYEECEQYLSNDYRFWWMFYDLLNTKGDIYKSSYCVYRAVTLETGENYA